MLLIDALNVKSRGGSVLLDYMEVALEKREIQFKILRNKDTNFTYQVRFNPITYFDRTSKIAAAVARYKPHTLLCFGNFPPGRRFPGIRIFTYIQSRFFVDSNAIESYGVVARSIIRLKRWYLKLLTRYSDTFIFQTPLVKNLFADRYGISSSACMVLPFFDEQAILNFKELFVAQNIEKVSCSFIYPTGVQTHKNLTQLLQAWSILLDRGYDPPLNLMIPTIDDNVELTDRITGLNRNGAKIINHGALSHADLLREVYRCSHVIFPSKEETIGLGIVEGLLLDCEILVSDEPYHRDIVQPTLVFDCDVPSSIAEAVMKVQSADNMKTSYRIIQNQIEELITVLENPKPLNH